MGKPKAKARTGRGTEKAPEEWLRKNTALADPAAGEAASPRPEHQDSVRSFGGGVLCLGTPTCPTPGAHTRWPLVIVSFIAMSLHLCMSLCVHDVYMCLKPSASRILNLPEL